MIRVEMPAERLAGLRWATSPVGELAAALVAVAEGAARPSAPVQSPASAEVRVALRTGCFPTLSAVVQGYVAYLPELLTPSPPSFLPSVEEQLHAVATARTEALRSQFTAFLAGGAARRRRCSWLREGELGGVDERVRARIEAAGTDLPDRLAAELHLLWSTVFATRWAVFTAGFEEFIERHSAVTAREGLRSALSALHSALSWQNSALEIASEHRGSVTGSHHITLVPTLYLGRVGLHAPQRPDAAQLVVPLSLTRTGPPRMEPVLGDTRMRLLQSIDRPRTTTELAALHHLTPATVSFHLSRLLDADLVGRQREGRQVRYHRTARAHNLLRGAGRP
ncbi:ArsR/SmtB family transcription factor [Streptomyces beigongshangae]|uniref:ArsR/SmtB family transcription factor n=1 Tax=Streptomyces beigongshangae TaxID=2841597 RepID=UPI001C864632|nr:winged helix-turn-helix domain-containing protein [Streptomyces sp. REN17]